MPNESPRNDPRKVWQSQPTEEFAMSAEALRDKANRLYVKARFMALFAIYAGLVVGALFAIAALRAHYLLTGLGWCFLSVFGLYGAYQSYRWNRPGELPEGAPVSASLEFYRTELERRRDHLQHIWRRSGLPLCFLGLALIVGPPLAAAFQTPRLLVNAVPFLVLLMGWVIAFFTINRRERAQLQRDIDELRAFEQSRSS